MVRQCMCSTHAMKGAGGDWMEQACIGLPAYMLARYVTAADMLHLSTANHVAAACKGKPRPGGAGGVQHAASDSSKEQWSYTSVVALAVAQELWSYTSVVALAVASTGAGTAWLALCGGLPVRQH